jgi:EF-hand domain-containing protein 1
LPGIRRSALSANPTLFKDYLSESLSANSLHQTDSSYFEDPEYIARVKTALNPYPSETPSYNDTTARYSLCSRQRDRASNNRALPYSDVNKAPAFVTNKDQLCNFTAYFTENVPENLEESRRIRVVDITLYVTDNSIEIREPFQPNSGLVQGKFLRRHLVKKPDGTGHYTVADFHAGAVLTMYNRDYTVIKCNSWTYRHLKSLGIEFGHDLSVPSTTDARTKRLNSSQTLSDSRPSSPEKFSMNSRPFTALSKSFYEHDKMVLRFYGYWEGKETPKPDRYRVRLHFYLTDNTIEIISEYGRNDGRDRVPKFLKKMRILKPSQRRGIMTSSQEEMLDASCFYQWSDISVGSTITVVGNDIMIYDADPFTRRYFEDNGMPLGNKLHVQFDAPAKKYDVDPPPYNGFGSEEDSLQTCSGSLMPKPPKKDGLKAKLFAQQILRFRMKFKTPRVSWAIMCVMQTN